MLFLKASDTTLHIHQFFAGSLSLLRQAFMQLGVKFSRSRAVSNKCDSISFW